MVPREGRVPRAPFRPHLSLTALERDVDDVQTDSTSVDTADSTDAATRAADRADSVAVTGPTSPGSTGVGLPPSLGAKVAAVDEAVDAWFEPFRGRPALDATAKVVASLSDHGFVWALEAAWRGRRRGPERRRVVRALAVAGIGSSLVNAAIKAAVGRTRPDRTSLSLRADQVPVREPTSSSFPSGHTLAAFCVATVMADGDRPLRTATRFAAAGMVGLSRLHLRAHHASDVVGGMVVGLAVGAAGRRLR